MAEHERETRRVVVAEDDAALRILVGGALRTAGFDVVLVEDGGRLLVELARRYRVSTGGAPALIVSDVQMPICTGLALLEAVRQARWPSAVLLMTAFPDDAVLARARKLHAEVLEKPFDAPDLVAAAHRAIEAGRVGR